MNIQTSLKKAAVNGLITLDKALIVAKRYDELQEESKELLRQAEKNSGMVLGERINAHLADIEGVKFSALDYNYERFPGEQ